MDIVKLLFLKHRSTVLDYVLTKSVFHTNKHAVCISVVQENEPQQI